MNKPKSIVLLAGGPSVSSYDITNICRQGYVIGVNESFVTYPFCDAGITMDRLWMQARADTIIDMKKTFFVRPDAVKFIQSKVKCHDFIQYFICREEAKLSKHWGAINGTSSGMCALNLAYLMKPEKIYLLGYDMGIDKKTFRGYWYKHYEWVPKTGGTKPGRYAEWVKQFAELARVFEKSHIKVYNVTHSSALSCFEKISFKDFMNDKK